MYLVAKPVLAVKDLWIIGDKFVNELFHAYPALNAEVKKQNTQHPFAYDFYNVRCFTSSPVSTTKSVPARLLNCLLKALNENNNLPRFVIVVPDWNLLQFMQHNGFGIMEMTAALVRWMVTNMLWAVGSKKEQLRMVKPGALISGEPKIIWVKMIKRLRGYSKLLAVCNKFNQVMEKVLAAKKSQYLIDLSPAINDSDLFTSANELNGDGRVTFWKELDNCLQLFDDHELPLMPSRHPK